VFFKALYDERVLFVALACASKPSESNSATLNCIGAEGLIHYLVSRGLIPKLSL